LWVRPLSDITGRYRETTPEFFQLNPAMTHRLVPWLNRELNVLLVSHENRLSYVLELILRLITQFHIRSRAFRDAIQSYIGGYTEHFIHEFFQYARSPYDMYGFDENADYQPRNNLQQEEVAVSESSDEDVPGTRPINNNSQSRVVIKDSKCPKVIYLNPFNELLFLIRHPVIFRCLLLPSRALVGLAEVLPRWLSTMVRVTPPCRVLPVQELDHQRRMRTTTWTLRLWK
jgi:E3 ubiquitin-protein ligase Topors